MGLSGRAAFALTQLVFSIALVVVGAIFLDDCPVEKMIPIFLIVAGATGIVLVILAFLQSWCYDEDMETDLNCWRLIIPVFMLFWSAWFIAGSYWIYTNYQPRYVRTTNAGRTDPKYCDKVLYLFSFWSINLTYMFFCVLIIAAIFLYFCMPDTWSQIWEY